VVRTSETDDCSLESTRLRRRCRTLRSAPEPDLLFRYHICLPLVAIGEHLDVALQIHLSLSMRMFPVVTNT